MGILSNKDEKGNFATGTMYYSGLPTKYYKGGELVQVIVNDNTQTLTFKKTEYFVNTNTPDITLSFDQIIGAGEITQEQLKEASVIGRAVIGGVLFGGIGAIVGGLSGTNKKMKNQKFFAISYKSSSGEEKTILFKYSPGVYMPLQKKIDEIILNSNRVQNDTNDPIQL